MLKLFIIVNALLMVSATYPTLQLLAGLPTAEDAYSFTSLDQLQALPVGSLTAAALGESLASTTESTSPPPAAAASSEETASQTQAPETTESSSSSETETSAQPSSAASLALPPISSLRSLSSLPSIQHHLLPAEQIPLPLTISTSPGLRTVLAPETITIHQPAVAKVGELVQKIPTAVSHQSQTVVHKHAEVITPIVAPAVRTITSQVVRAYHTPLVYAAHAPVIKLLHN